MSQWGTLEARFRGKHVSKWLVEEGLPRGSESGPRVFEHKGEFSVEGRLRDVDDYDSPAVLAWFVRVCDHGLADEAKLLWDLDRGPRYRYEWRDDGLHKIKGVLDQ